MYPKKVSYGGAPVSRRFLNPHFVIGTYDDEGALITDQIGGHTSGNIGTWGGSVTFNGKPATTVGVSVKVYIRFDPPEGWFHISGDKVLERNVSEGSRGVFSNGRGIVLHEASVPLYPEKGVFVSGSVENIYANR